MKDKLGLLARIMRHLAANETEAADKLIEVFMNQVPEISADEIAKTAQELDDEGVFDNAEQHVSIERKVFAVIDQKIPVQDLSNYGPGHPIHTFREENKMLRKLVERSRKLLETANSFTRLHSDWVLIAKEFQQAELHYLRKENQLFPFLEKRGFSHPSSIMWSLHDEIRMLAKNFRKAVDEKNEAQSKTLLARVSREVDEMIVKEEKVLLPRSSKLLSNDNWKEIRKGEDEIGWIIDPPPASWQPLKDMSQHLDIDAKRIEVILEIIRDFFAGKAPHELEKVIQKELGGSISPAEFALAEQKVQEHEVSDLQFKEQIDELLKVFRASFEKVEVGGLEEGHPVETFIRENKAIQELLREVREENSRANSTMPKEKFWEVAYEKIGQINLHYVRKENQLFPYLEDKGFDKPSTVMWALHDDVRQLIKYYSELVKSAGFEELFSTQEMLFSAIEDMIYKEEKILWPTSLELLSEEEWVEIRKGEDEIGWCLIPKPPMWNPLWTHPSTAAPESMPPESDLSGTAGINLEIGCISPEQINLIFSHLPFDVTYVDENNEVRFYNKGEGRIFPRSPGIIGRQVKYCHPPKSVHMVERIVDAFRKGEKNEASFWIDFREKFIHIQYFAVRDAEGKYRGVVEISYDAKPVRSLEGEQRLLDWE